MIRIELLDKTIESIKDYLKDHSIANRGRFDGSKRNQAVGLVGEFEVHNYLLGEFPDLTTKTDGYDGGYDLIFKGKKIDVKTMERKSFVRPNYVNNFSGLQLNHNADILVFCSYNSVKKITEVCGWINKEDLTTKGVLYKKGSVRTRDDGTSLIMLEDNYEIAMNELKDIRILRSKQIRCTTFTTP